MTVTTSPDLKLTPSPTKRNASRRRWDFPRWIQGENPRFVQNRRRAGQALHAHPGPFQVFEQLGCEEGPQEGARGEGLRTNCKGRGTRGVRLPQKGIQVRKHHVANECRTCGREGCIEKVVDLGGRERLPPALTLWTNEQTAIQTPPSISTPRIVPLPSRPICCIPGILKIPGRKPLPSILGWGTGRDRDRS